MLKGAIHFIMKILARDSSCSALVYISSIFCQTRNLAQESINRVELSKPLLLLFNKSWHTKGSFSELEKANVVSEFLKVKQDDPGNSRSRAVIGRLRLSISNKD